ncbi:MAG: hypothetical protein JWQ56_3540 [Pseudarthrobacter sp.]|nr:hypothetical protein [Pseudarthrobacter sp.]
MFKAPRVCSASVLTAVLFIFAAAFSVLAAPQPASAAGTPPPVKLSLKPVGQPGAYFALTMQSGQRLNLQAELGNYGTGLVEARSYAADAYTIVNGGFGARERDSRPSGTTTWLTYPTAVLQLPAGQSKLRAFSVAVPAGTAAGQYLTSLVLENNIPVKGSGTVALNQIIRQVIAVSITVPGPLHPGFSFGSASHKVTAGKSVVDIDIANSGNANIKPAGEFTIRDSAGKTVSQAALAMESFYAHTETQVETTLGGQLQPGNYTVTVKLTDRTTKATATAENLPFTVAAPDATNSTATQENQLPQILQGSGPGLLLYVGAAALLAVFLIVALFIRRSRR